VFEKNVVRQVLFSEYLTPMFRSKGFARRGNTYYHCGENGDYGYVDITTSTSTGRSWYVFTLPGVLPQRLGLIISPSMGR
jgi:hypothetical protein